MDYENLVAGAPPGGLQDVYQIKILICYLLENVEKTLTLDELNEVFQYKTVVNYFAYSQAVSELLESGHIIVDNGKCVIMPLGVQTSQKLSYVLPKSVKKNVVQSAMLLIAASRKQAETDIKITKLKPGGCTVTITQHDNEIDLMKVTLYTADEMQADLIAKRAKKNPIQIYLGVTALLTGDKDIFESIFQEII